MSTAVALRESNPKPVRIKRSTTVKPKSIGTPIRDIDAEADQKGMLLTKSFEFVHVTNNLSLVQRKMVNVLLHNAYQNLLTTDVHKIHLSVLLNMLGVERNNLEYIKAAFRALLDIKLEWSILDSQNREKWATATAVAQAEISGDFAYYAYAPVVRRKLFDPRMGSIINLIVQNNFASNYALALYENCLRYREDGKTVWIPLDIFKMLLGATSQSYSEYKVFNKNVLTPAINEVNRVSNIFLKPEFQREGRKISAVRFLLTPQSQALLDLRGGEDATTFPVELAKRITEYGVNEEVAKSFAVTYPDEQINKALTYVDEQVKAGKVKLDGVPGFTVKAIKGGWGKTVTKFDRAQQQLATQQAEIDRQVAEAEQKTANARVAWAQYREERLNAILSALTDEERDQLQNDFIGSLKQYERNLMKTNGFESPFITNRFKAVLSEKFLVKPEENDFDVFFAMHSKGEI